MPSSPSATPTPITPPRVAMIDQRTGLIDRAWYMFFLSLFNTAVVAQDAAIGPDTDSLLASFDAELRTLSDEVGTQYDAQSGVASLAAALAALEQQFAVQPSTEIGELQQQIDALAQAVAIQPAALSLNSGAFFNIIGPATAGSVAYGDGSSIAFSAAGSSGQLLASSGTGAPTWTSLSSIGVTSISFGSTGLTPATATSGAITVAGTLVVANGGTGVSTAAATYVFAGPTSGGAAAPSFRALVAGDVPALSYVSSVSATAPITSTGGLTPTIAVTSAALTKTDDTNVTLTLGGSPTTALLAATSLTLGWSGQLAVGRGGLGISTTPSNGFVPIGNGTNYTAAALTAGTGITITNASGAITIAATAGGGSAPITKTANFTVGVGESWYINNKTGSACTVTLPTASSYTGRELTFVNYQAQTLISASSNVVPLGGGSAGTAILAASVGDWATLVSDGTNWIIMQAAANNCLLLE